MNEIQFFSEKIQEISRELGVSTASGFLEESQVQLDALANSDVLDADVYLGATFFPSFFNLAGMDHSEMDVYKVENTTPKVKKLIQSWSAGAGVRVNIITPGNLKSKPIGQPSPAFAIFFMDEGVAEDPLLQLFKVALVDQYKMVVIVNCRSGADEAQQMARSLGPRLKSRIMNIADVEQKTLKELMEESIPAAQIPLLKSLGRLNQVKPVIGLLQQVFQTENKILQTRKLLGAQNQLITRKDEQGLNNMELGNNIRQAISKFTSDMDKTFRTKYEELNKPVTGGISRQISSLSEQLTDFKREHLAEKDEKVEIKLEEEYQAMFLEQMKTYLTGEMKKDAEFMSASVKELLSRINSLLGNKGIGQISIPSDIIEFPDIRKSITPYCQFNKTYKSELMKKGMMEYFVALRDYTGIIMVATGLLGPLTIIANISEIGFLKTLNAGIKFGMAGICIFLIGYGIYDLRTRIPKKRKEEFLKELEKGREFVQNEGKRIGNEVSRDWISASGSWVKEISQAISSAFEKKIKDSQQSRSNALNQDKVQQQRRQQSLDAQTKNIANAERVKEMITSRFRDMYADTEKKLTF